MFDCVILTTGEVTSKNYLNNYPNSIDTTETIEVNEGLVVAITFSAFDVDYHSTCSYDYLTIKDGDGTTLMGKKCGSSLVDPSHDTYALLPVNLTSKSNIVKLHFSTSYSGTKTGWSANWIAVMPGEYPHPLSKKRSA